MAMKFEVYIRHLSENNPKQLYFGVFIDLDRKPH
jgi:hypothetical protein